MNVELVTITPDIEKTIVYIARVSSSRKDKAAKPEGLLNYLIRNKHWSPFEHGYITFEIETTKAIAIQLLRHRSFTFQEFSQRYQDVGLLKDEKNEFVERVELRKQAEDNRQSSTETYTDGNTEHAVLFLMQDIQDLYESMLIKGVARECARMILPMATRTRLYMTGSVRSWIHFLELRDDEHAQKEIQEVAREIKKIFIKELPICSKALGYV